MANGEHGGNGNGWKGWALTLVGGGLLSMLGLWNTTLERRVARSEDREIGVHVGIAIINAKLDAWLESRGIDPEPIEKKAEQKAIREVSGP